MPPPHSEEARRFLRSIMPEVVISLMGFAYEFQEDGQPSTLSKVDRRRAGESLIRAGWVTRGELDTLTVPEAITRFGILNRTGLSDREPAQIEVPPVATMSKDEIPS